jgi:hypothetical protein
MRIATIALALASLIAPNVCGEDPPPQYLVIVVDGLRPDYVTPEHMPALRRLGEQGVFFEQHHAVIPTVTRVNSPSISTGSYPESHGLMGNSIYVPSVDPDRALNTSDYRNLVKVRETEGKLLTATTIGEVLDQSGKQFLAISSGSSGSAYLLNPGLNGAGLINVDVILPESLRERVEFAIGPAPEDSLPATPRIRWTVDAYIELGLKEIHPDVTILWMTDPDHTAHSAGIGAPDTVASLRGVDDQIARILEAHERLGLNDRMNIIVTSDHGFSTHSGGFNLSLYLSRHGFNEGVHVAGDAVYVDGHDPARIAQIVGLLREQPTAGVIFTRGVDTDAFDGSVPGTFSFAAIHWQHDRSADILAFPEWGSEVNEYGFAGHTAYSGVAGHGSTSEWDIHNTLIAAGRAFKRGLRSSVPSANPDIAPTVLHLLGIAPPGSMTGRVLGEAIAGGPDPASMQVGQHRVDQKSMEGPPRVTWIRWSIVEGRRYVDSATSAIPEP